jgi:hypothetical protein
MSEKLDEIAERLKAEVADEAVADSLERIRAALGEAVAEERKALREIVAKLDVVKVMGADEDPLDTYDALWREDALASLDAREAKR